MQIKSQFGNYDIAFKNNFKESKNKKYFYIVDSFFKKNTLKYNKTNTIFIKSSEKIKSYDYVSIVIKQLLNKGIDKNSTLVCVGGGTVQDLTSFISNILFRGISWVFIPTTLLAQCDSCIGSKIAINFQKTKNVIGGYCPPKKVFIDFDLLKTLKRSDFLSGLGEMSHYYYLSTNNNFKFFSKNILHFFDRKEINLKKLIYKSLNIKKYFIEKDEFEKNIRIFLNYGHSFGHAIEALSKFKIPHGIAVSLGMQIANYVSYRLGHITKKQLVILQKPLELITKNYTFNGFSEIKMIKILIKDKKTTNNNIRLILIKNIGKPFIYQVRNKNLLIKYLADFKKNLI